MNLQRRTLPVIMVAATFAVVVPLAASRGDGARGQVLPPGPPSTPVPTAPCPGCGPTPGTAIVKDFAWSYPLHFCPLEQQLAGDTRFGPAGSAIYAMVYGLGRDATTGPVTFYGEINGIMRTLNTITASDRSFEFPLPPVAFGVVFNLTMWATPAGTGPDGPRIRWGNGGTSRSDVLTCDCVQPPGTPGAPPAGFTPSTAPGATVPLIPPSR